MKTTSQILHEIETTPGDIVYADRIRRDSPWHIARRPHDGKQIYVVGVMTSLYNIATPPARIATTAGACR